MKHLKMLGLAAIAAMGLMAFLGASAASATVLCKQDVTSGCTSKIEATKTLTFSAEGSTFLTGPFGEIVSTCTGSTVSGNVTNAGGAAATVVGSITSLSFTGCTKTVTTTNTSGVTTTGTLEVHSIAGTDNGTVTSNDTTVTIDNTILGTCHFLTSNTPLGTLTGTQKTGGAATFDIEAKIPSENCGFSGQWHGKYVYTGTENFNVSAS
jgi:hypothetical protein